MKGPRKWMKKFVCALSIFAMSATSFTPVIYAQDAAKEKEEAAAIQDVQSYIAIEQTSRHTIFVFVSSPEEVLPEMLSPLPKTIGICGATSTPRWQMEQIASRIRELLGMPEETDEA